MDKEELKQILKENLKLKIDLKSHYNSFLGPKYLKVQIEILFDDETIAIADAIKSIK